MGASAETDNPRTGCCGRPLESLPGRGGPTPRFAAALAVTEPDGSVYHCTLLRPVLLLHDTAVRSVVIGHIIRTGRPTGDPIDHPNGAPPPAPARLQERFVSLMLLDTHLRECEPLTSDPAIPLRPRLARSPAETPPAVRCHTAQPIAHTLPRSTGLRNA